MSEWSRSWLQEGRAPSACSCPGLLRTLLRIRRPAVPVTPGILRPGGPGRDPRSSWCAWASSLVAQTVKNLSAIWETQVWSLGWEDPLEKEMATHSSTLAWKIPWTEEPGRLQSIGSLRVKHDWVTSLTYLLQKKKDGFQNGSIRWVEGMGNRVYFK